MSWTYQYFSGIIRLQLHHWQLQAERTHHRLLSAQLVRSTAPTVRKNERRSKSRVCYLPTIVDLVKGSETHEDHHDALYRR